MNISLSLLLALAATQTAQSAQVLRGQSETPSQLFRLFDNKKKHKKKKEPYKLSPAWTADHKLPAGSAAAAAAPMENTKKCMKRKVVAATPAAETAAIADPAMTTTLSSAAAITTTIPNAPETQEDGWSFFDALMTTTEGTTATGATEGISSPQLRASVQFVATEFSEEWEVICDENGNLVSSTTFFPTASPGNDDFTFVESGNLFQDDDSDLDDDVQNDPSDQTNSVIVGAALEENGNSEESFSTVGIALISIGSVAILSLLALIVAKKTRESSDEYSEFYDEQHDFNKNWAQVDDASLDDRTINSISSNDSAKMAVVYNGEESVVSEMNASTIIRELYASEAAAAAHDISEDESLRKQPVFLSMHDGIMNEGVEVYDLNRSISRPTFENPAGLGKDQREYDANDTVEF